MFRPTLEADYKRFFAMSTAERMNVPLSSLALFLMVCSLGGFPFWSVVRDNSDSQAA